MGELNMRFNPMADDNDFFVQPAPGAEQAKVEILKDDNGVRYGFFIDVSNIDVTKAQEFLQRAKDELKKKKRFKKPDEPPTE